MIFWLNIKEGEVRKSNDAVAVAEKVD